MTTEFELAMLVDAAALDSVLDVCMVIIVVVDTGVVELLVGVDTGAVVLLVVVLKMPMWFLVRLSMLFETRA